MSATILYQPVQGTALNVGAPSSFMVALQRALGKPQPWVISENDYRLLKGLAAGLESTDQREAVEELAEAAMKHGEIRVWAEY